MTDSAGVPPRADLVRPCPDEAEALPWVPARVPARVPAALRAVVVDTPEAVDERVEVHVEDGSGGRGEPFPWARLGARALRAQAADAGWTRAVTWNAAGRAFAQLRR
ncbi:MULTISPECIES: hypothetical protein [unclassified Streptomyces]|uniref:hypothetical protein n=1 Tax=unclassified Streptomyces TaxID=2593676 RepID=UPI0033232573